MPQRPFQAFTIKFNGMSRRIEASKIAWANVGRNQPCPCGKKNEKGEPVLFKFCHKPMLE